MPLPTVTILRILFYLSLAIWSTNAQGVTTTAISTINPSTTRTSESPTLASTTSLGSPVPTTAPDLGDCISNCTCQARTRTAQLRSTTAVRCVCNTPILRTALDNCVKTTCPDQLALLFGSCDSSQFKDPSEVVPSLGGPTSAPPDVSPAPDPAPPIVVGGDSDGNNTGSGSASADEKRPMGGGAEVSPRAHDTSASVLILAIIVHLLHCQSSNPGSRLLLLSQQSTIKHSRPAQVSVASGEASIDKMGARVGWISAKAARPDSAAGWRCLGRQGGLCQ
ncbi:hypothetical protein EXIGLDRAFT_700757 [Exidia glandulosa HHB12029]|uniref:Extracellular membrane protein CFEM domain-containing protein n=1 Tax=Exidia glandulosa HHB12029 TaxID=1314781 RepID=A0A165DAP7_EXIGL|nr:hypothetical protein EXIGLDRAFT_700757 [Exidia glandulosa HHB12029]